MPAVTIKQDAAQRYDAGEQLERVAAALGSNSVAAVLGVAKSQPSRWRSGRDRISPSNRRLLCDLDHVLDRLLQVLPPGPASDWLSSPDPYLGGGRPVDVLRLRGAAPVLTAIDALAQGAYL